MKELKMSMIIPFDTYGIPVIPVNLYSWIKRSAIGNRTIIDFGGKIEIEQFDDAIYISTINKFNRKDEFLRYDVLTDKVMYFNEGQPIEVKTLYELQKYYSNHCTNNSCTESELNIL
ncbi:MAG: hypothetical protein ABIP51_05085 [Bacteroidia bacterium]